MNHKAQGQRLCPVASNRSLRIALRNTHHAADERRRALETLSLFVFRKHRSLMSRRTWKQWFTQLFKRSSSDRGRLQGKLPAMRRTALFEQLDSRITPTVNAFFSAGILTVNGDNANNTIDVSRDAAGKLLVNGGAISIKGGIA